jgi:hypothetical protein
MLVLSMRNFGQMVLLTASVLTVPAFMWGIDAWAAGDASQPIAWKYGAINAALSATAAPDGSQVGGTSKLELDTAGLQAAVTGTIVTSAAHDTGPDDAPALAAVSGDTGSWTRAQLGVKAQAQGPLNSKIAISGQDRISQAVLPYTPGTGAARQTLETQTLAGTVSATAPVSAKLDAQIGASASKASTRSATVDDGTGSHLETGDTQISGSLAYKVAKGVTVTAGASVEQQTARLDGDAANSASYAYVKPKAGVVIAPWQGATVKVGAEHAVDPLNGANYVALANLSDRPRDLKIAPDHAWQYQASLEQKLGAADFSAAVTRSRDGTATELAPVADGQTPASVALKNRQKATVAISMPLDAFGLSDTELQSQATWRSSRVRDPVTGKYRRANGETPREASVKLTRDLPGAADTRIGISGQLATNREFYQVGQTTQMHTAPRLGAFLSYDPGPRAFDLRVDGLAGGSQSFTDTYYAGSRTGPVTGVTSRNANDAHISLSFRRKM